MAKEIKTLETLSGEFQVLASMGELRLTTITKIGIGEEGEIGAVHLPVSEGLAIESKVPNEETFVVIAFVRTDKDGLFDHYESVMDRITEYCPTQQDVQTFRMIIQMAKATLQFYAEKKPTEEE